MIVAPYTKTWTIDDPPSSAVAYSGSGWSHSTGNASDIGTTESTDSGTLGDTVTVTLPTGASSFTWYYTKTSSSGNASIQVDGGAATTVNQYSSTGTQYQQTYGPIAVSSGSSHTITIKVLHTKSAGSSNYRVSLDAILGAYASGTLMTTTPHVIVTDNNTGCGAAKGYPPEQVPTATQGALAYPGMPYGSYSVCVDDGVNHDTLNINNTSYTTGNVPTGNSPTAGVFNIFSGATGYGTGVCT